MAPAPLCGAYSAVTCGAKGSAFAQHREGEAGTTNDDALTAVSPVLTRPTPAIILVEPQLAENIGMAARAMANFGLSELRLVAPRNGWPKKGARSAASGAAHVLDGAQALRDRSRGDRRSQLRPRDHGAASAGR